MPKLNSFLSLRTSLNSSQLNRASPTSGQLYYGNQNNHLQAYPYSPNFRKYSFKSSNQNVIQAPEILDPLEQQRLALIRKQNMESYAQLVRERDQRQLLKRQKMQEQQQSSLYSQAAPEVGDKNDLLLNSHLNTSGGRATDASRKNTQNSDHYQNQKHDNCEQRRKNGNGNSGVDAHSTYAYNSQIHFQNQNPHILQQYLSSPSSASFSPMSNSGCAGNGSCSGFNPH